MSWENCWYLIRSDVYRVAGRIDVWAVLRTAVTNPSSRYLLVFRLGAWARSSQRSRLVVRVLTGMLQRRWSVRYGIEIPFSTTVGPGLKISHRVGGVVVNPDAVVGSGVTLTPGVVIGNNAGRGGAPRIGDRVVLSVGTKVIGSVEIGHDTQVGANSVVTRNLAPGVVAAGSPARVLEGRDPLRASRTDFESALGRLPSSA